MTRQTGQVGFSQRVRLEWFEQTANLVMAGNDKTAINEALQNMLKDKVSVGGQAKAGNREKVINILRKVWVTTPPLLIPLRDDALEFLKTQLLSVNPHSLSVVLNWGMVMAVYPFWHDVGTQVGRLLRLQGSAATGHVQRRIREQYGERETVSRATRRVLRSYLDWGVLQKTSTRGIYITGPALVIDDSHLIAWLVEASLHARPNGSASLKEVVDSPSLFPFQIRPIHAENLVADAPRLDILRHGLDDALIMLQ
ncbi:MAG: hypothetical protein DDT37_01372 [Firmicutes bacterium]|nr:hypothetical protein [candidate division NPL-UPA2 bacterium]